MCIFVRCRLKYFYFHYMFFSWDTGWVACLSTVFSLITNLVTLRELAEWLQSCVSHRSHNIVTALQNLIERLSLCTSSTMDSNLIFLQHIITYFVRTSQVRKNTNHLSRNMPRNFLFAAPFLWTDCKMKFQLWLNRNLVVVSVLIRNRH